MIINFDEDQMSEFLLARGYIICVRVEMVAVNIYQNVFVDESRVIIEAIKNNKTESLETAFEKEFKQHLLGI